MKLAAPLIVDGLVELLPQRPSWAAAGDRAAVFVSDGPAVRADDTREWCTVGYVAETTDAALSFEAVPDAQGSSREAGAVVSGLVVAGDDIAAARQRTAVLLQEWADLLHRDRTLGGRLLAGSEAHLSADVALGQSRGGGGLATTLVVVNYRAVTYG